MIFFDVTCSLILLDGCFVINVIIKKLFVFWRLLNYQKDDGKTDRGTSIDVEMVKSVNNYRGADESINKISSFEAPLSDRTETSLSFFLFWRSRLISHLYGSIQVMDRKTLNHCSGGSTRNWKKPNKEKVSRRRRNINYVLWLADINPLNLFKYLEMEFFPSDSRWKSKLLEEMFISFSFQNRWIEFNCAKNKNVELSNLAWISQMLGCWRRICQSKLTVEVSGKNWKPLGTSSFESDFTLPIVFGFQPTWKINIGEKGRTCGNFSCLH
jgi:hypothetical protein